MASITVFVELPGSKIELLTPLGENSPIANFLARNPGGGVHHLCFEVDDILAARDRLAGEGRAAGGRRRAQNRRAWQAGAVPASQGFRRHLDRAGTGMTIPGFLHYVVLFSAYAVLWFLALFCLLPIGLGRSAIRRPARRSIRISSARRSGRPASRRCCGWFSISRSALAGWSCERGAPEKRKGRSWLRPLPASRRISSPNLAAFRDDSL